MKEDVRYSPSFTNAQTKPLEIRRYLKFWFTSERVKKNNIFCQHLRVASAHRMVV